MNTSEREKQIQELMLQNGTGRKFVNKLEAFMNSERKEALQRQALWYLGLIIFLSIIFIGTYWTKH